MIKNKRNLLKVMSVAGATGAVWKKPVVDSVVLPAHARATTDDVPPDTTDDVPCILPLNFDDVTSTCSTGENTNEQFRYRINASGSCPVLEGPFSELPANPWIQFSVIYNSVTNSARISYLARNQGGAQVDSTLASLNCESSTVTLTPDTSLLAEDSEGGSWTVSFNFSSTPTSISFTNIVANPAL